jgi:hypothetical protein
MKNLRRLTASPEPGLRVNWDNQTRVVHPWEGRLKMVNALYFPIRHGGRKRAAGVRDLFQSRLACP